LELFELFLSYKKLVLGRLQELFSKFCANEKMTSPKFLPVVGTDFTTRSNYFTARWSLERTVLYQPPKQRKRPCKEETRDGIHQYFYNFSIFFLSFF
jgi:hypothetical protein